MRIVEHHQHSEVLIPEGPGSAQQDAGRHVAPGVRADTTNECFHNVSERNPRRTFEHGLFWKTDGPRKDDTQNRSQTIHEEQLPSGIFHPGLICYGLNGYFSLNAHLEIADGFFNGQEQRAAASAPHI